MIGKVTGCKGLNIYVAAILSYNWAMMVILTLHVINIREMYVSMVLRCLLVRDG